MKHLLFLLIGVLTFVSPSLAQETCTSTAYPLTVSADGSGTVSSPRFGIYCSGTCIYNYNSGTTITMNAAPGSGTNFAGWSGCDYANNTACTVTITTTPKNPVASFTTGPVSTLSVTKTGTGIGTIVSNPSRINCGLTCSNLFASGTSVTLTATADPMSSFTGWSGPCSGTGTCTLTLNSTMSVSASFVSGCIGNPARIGTTTYATLQQAYNAAPSGATIKVQARTLTENLFVNRNISVILDGGYTCDYSSNTGRTTSLKGMIQTTAGGGTLTIRNFILTNQ